jgi:hypothetical protein
LRALGNYLSDGAKSDLLALSQLPVDSAPAPDRPRSGLSPAWKWLALAGAVGGAGLGAYWLALDGSGSCAHDPCPELYTTAPQGYTALGVGAALAATFVVLLYREHERVALGIAPTTRSLSVAVRF